jgi:AAA+ superfamily predicted ATPase
LVSGRVNDARDLTLILRSRFPLVAIETHEESRATLLLERICSLEEWALFAWSVTTGLEQRSRKGTVPATAELGAALRHIEKTPQNGIYVLYDAHPFLEDPVIRRLIREIALGYHKTARTLVFVSPAIELPPELARLAARFSLSLLDLPAIRKLFKEEAEMYERDEGRPVQGQQDAFNILAQHLVGLCHDDARRHARNAIRDDGAITMADVRRVLQAKHQAFGADAVLSLELDTVRLEDVAGLAELKSWLARRRPVFLGARRIPGVDAPKGILLLGVQGGGKSLAAKAVAGAWGVPLMRLDFAVLYNKFIGETERRLREALKQADAMAPCVLWIDEIEKGVAGAAGNDGDGGVSRRVLGTLLTWMAERKRRVFLVATANDVSALPPELLRKGRFDEIFFVDLPDAATRGAIFAIHLARRGLAAENFDLARLAAAAEGFSGAEIEEAVVSALYESHASGRAMDTELIAEEIARTRPLSVVMAERIAALRDWAVGRAVMAG